MVLSCAEEDYEHLQAHSNRLQALAGDHQQHIDEVSTSLAAWAEHQRSAHAHPHLLIPEQMHLSHFLHVMGDFELSFKPLGRRVHELQDKCGALMAELRRATSAADEAHDRAMYTVRAQVVLKEVILQAQPGAMRHLL